MIKNFIKLVLILATINISFSVESEGIHYQIMDSLKTQSMKTQFKAYHFIFEKTYDLNTEEGIRRYKIFSKNVKEINEHNESDSTFKMGINHLTDMTFEEVNEYYNLKPLSEDEVKMKFRNLDMFDDYNEEDDNTPISTTSVANRVPVDHRQHMTLVRNQGGCGSCWAFTTLSTVEGCWNKSHTTKLSGWLSTQQLVDCDLSNGGCNGGWYSGAMRYLTGVKVNYEKDYIYKAKRGTCTISKTTSPVQIKETIAINNSKYLRDVDWVKLMLAGPVAVAIEATQAWMGYRSGLWDSPCKGRVTHAVTLVGYGVEAGKGYYLIRNSWGDRWGDKGHMKMAINKLNNQTCFLEIHGYAPKSFTA